MDPQAEPVHGRNNDGASNSRDAHDGVVPADSATPANEPPGDALPSDQDKPLALPVSLELSEWSDLEGAASQIDLATMSQVAQGYVDPADIEKFRPSLVVRSGRDGWSYIIPRLANLSEFPLEKIIPQSEGGMGWVVKATQLNLGRDVAVKISKSEALAERFAKEAEKTASLENSHIPKIHFYGKMGGLPFFAMEWVEGPTLEEVRRARVLGPALDWRRAEGRQILTHIKNASEAVHYAHEKGIVHRDIKPENLKISEKDGVVKVLDWGLLKITGESSSAEESNGGAGPDFGSLDSASSGLPSSYSMTYGHTRVGVVAGTPSYMSPEQARGDREVDSRTDVWGLGATLYAMVCNKSPVEHLDVAARGAALRSGKDFVPSPHSANEKVPAELSAILLKCLRGDPAKRYQSAQELADDIGRFLSGSPVHAYLEGLTTVRRALDYLKRALLAPVYAVKNHPKVAAAVLGTALVGGYGARQYSEAVERDRVATAEREDTKRSLEDALARGGERETLATQLAAQNKVGEARALLSPELFSLLEKYSDDPRIEYLISTLEKRSEEWKLLLELRRVTIEEQEKRINSFEIGEFAPFDLAAFTSVFRVYLKGGFTDEAVDEFIDLMKGASYTRQQREEIMIVLGQALVLELRGRFLPPLSIPKDEQDEVLKEGLKNLDRFDRLLSGCWIDGEYQTPATVRRYRYIILKELERRDEAMENAERARDAGSAYPIISIFPDVMHRILRQKTANIYELGIANDASAVLPGNLAAALLAASTTYDVYRREVNKERKAERLLELIAIYERCLVNVQDNPFLLAQYGRVALALARNQEYLPDDSRTMLSGRVVAVEAFTKCLDLCRERGISIPVDLQFDAAHAYILGQYQAERGRVLLEKIQEDCADPRFARLLFQRACAMTGVPLDLDFAEELLEDEAFQRRYPSEATTIFYRLQYEDSANAGRWEAAFEAVLTKLLHENSELEPLVKRLRYRAEFVRAIPIKEN
jgi:serine/threonine protein kinase